MENVGTIHPPLAPYIFFNCFCGNGPMFVTKTGKCNICMGMAEPADFVSEPTETSDGKFDMEYFEALERKFESFDFAA